MLTTCVSPFPFYANATQGGIPNDVLGVLANEIMDEDDVRNLAKELSFSDVGIDKFIWSTPTAVVAGPGIY